MKEQCLHFPANRVDVVQLLTLLISEKQTQSIYN